MLVPAPHGSQRQIVGRAAPRAIARSGEQRCRSHRRGRTRRRCGPAGSDRSAPSRCVLHPAARPRPLPEAETVGVGVSLSSLLQSFEQQQRRSRVAEIDGAVLHGIPARDGTRHAEHGAMRAGAQAAPGPTSNGAMCRPSVEVPVRSLGIRRMVRSYFAREPTTSGRAWGGRPSPPPPLRPQFLKKQKLSTSTSQSRSGHHGTPFRANWA